MGNKRQRLAKKRRIAGESCSFCVIFKLLFSILLILPRTGVWLKLCRSVFSELQFAN